MSTSIRLPLPPPSLLLRPLARVPRPLVALVLDSALGRLLRPGDLDFLRQRRLRIRVRDLGIDWLLTLDSGGLRALDPAQPADTSISGNLREFLLLASRREDPDTLFFQRRLVVEGDTELGLQVKNLLDAVELEALPRPARRLLEAAAAAGVGQPT